MSWLRVWTGCGWTMGAPTSRTRTTRSRCLASTRNSSSSPPNGAVSLILPERRRSLQPTQYATHAHATAHTAHNPHHRVRVSRGGPVIAGQASDIGQRIAHVPGGDVPAARNDVQRVGRVEEPHLHPHRPVRAPQPGQAARVPLLLGARLLGLQPHRHPGRPRPAPHRGRAAAADLLPAAALAQPGRGRNDAHRRERLARACVGVQVPDLRGRLAGRDGRQPGLAGDRGRVGGRPGVQHDPVLSGLAAHRRIPRAPGVADRQADRTNGGRRLAVLPLARLHVRVPHRYAHTTRTPHTTPAHPHTHTRWSYSSRFLFAQALCTLSTA